PRRGAGRVEPPEGDRARGAKADPAHVALEPGAHGPAPGAVAAALVQDRRPRDRGGVQASRGEEILMGSTFGRLLTITTFGESHGPAVGGIVDGVPPAIAVDPAMIQKDLDRRKPGQSAVTTQRKEPDQVEILSGVFEGVTTGASIALVVRSVDARSQDYAELRDLYRPGHADFTYWE